MYQEAKEKAKEHFQKAVAVSLTPDIWTFINMDAYLAFKEDALGSLLKPVHCIYPGGRRTNGELDAAMDWQMLISLSY